MEFNELISKFVVVFKLVPWRDSLFWIYSLRTGSDNNTLAIRARGIMIIIIPGNVANFFENA